MFFKSELDTKLPKLVQLKKLLRLVRKIKEMSSFMHSLHVMDKSGITFDSRTLKIAIFIVFQLLDS